MKYLGGPMEQGDEVVAAWYRHWIAEGFQALEELVTRYGAPAGYCFGDSVTMADCLLVPQMWNARRFDAELAPFPRLVEIDARLQQIEAFRVAAPENQPDFPG
jgi:maleylacetoacetate isomerase